MDNKTFFDIVRVRPFGGTLTEGQVQGLLTLLHAFQSARWSVAWAAYGLATAFHETARTMQPIEEYGKGRGHKYGQPDPITGRTYYGRGYVQLTWGYNYRKASDELGIDFVRSPERALEPSFAAAIMVRGMEEGWFTGKKMATFLSRNPPDYVAARRIINGTDRAAMIATYAKEFEHALRAAGYGATLPIPTPAPQPTTPAPAPPVRPAPSAPQPITQPGFWSRFWNALTRRPS